MRLLLAMLLTNSSSLFAQNSPYSGGDGSGIAIAASANRVCNSAFGGGNAAGFANDTTWVLNCVTTSFSGGNAAGAVSIFLVKNLLGNDTTVFVICANNTFNLLTLFDTTGLNAQWSTATPTVALPGNYTLIATTTTGCKDTARATVSQSVARWLGTTSSDWHTAANWNSNKVPTLSDHVIVPGGTTFSCIISNADAEAASVQLRMAGNITVQNNRKLLIAANCTSLPTGN
jgi:hypothetical protein